MGLLSGLFGRDAAATIDDLETWEEENDKRLPMSAEAIAHLEACGLLVDLETGAVTRDPDADRDWRN